MFVTIEDETGDVQLSGAVHPVGVFMLRCWDAPLQTAALRWGR